MASASESSGQCARGAPLRKEELMSKRKKMSLEQGASGMCGIKDSVGVWAFDLENLSKSKGFLMERIKFSDLSWRVNLVSLGIRSHVKEWIEQFESRLEVSYVEKQGYVRNKDQGI